jgi:MoaA/NifB/PqqE/SkfB family radical SAM enzyme
MCNIWKRAREFPNIATPEISQKEVIDLLSHSLFSELVELDITGGEPCLRHDLVDIVLELAGLRKSRLPNLRSIIVTTNGLLPRRIIANCRKILEGLGGFPIDLVSVVSIDGIGAIHDRIRGTPNAFKLATEAIEGLVQLRQEYPNYFVGLKTTILPENVDVLDAILDFALEKSLFHIISPVFFVETRFRNIDRKEDLKLGPADMEKVKGFYGRKEFRASYFYSRARNTLVSGRKKWSCTAFYNYLFVESDGTVYPCELISESLGNVRNQEIDHIWDSPQARFWRGKIDKAEHCQSCIEPGAIRYSAHTEGFSYLRFLLKLGKRRFRDSLNGEGLCKYFGNGQPVA